MNESYVECLVAKKAGPLDIFLKGLLIAVVAICIILGLFSGSIVIMILAIALGFGAYFLIPMFDIEYEYLYLDREITIDKIMSKQRRKRMAVYDLGKMELLAPETSHEFDSYKARNVKVRDFSSNMPDHKAYLMAYHDEKEECLVKFEPNEEMIKCIKQIAMRKVRDY
ncbi:MAG: DUF6106 family protein [Lachnospiraceae bacterium]|nr:DUF6106 family protein [Lachnospiraceae bacterium]